MIVVYVPLPLWNGREASCVSLIAVDCNLRLGESEGTQRFDNLPRQQHAAGHHPEVRKRIPFSPQNRFNSVAVETIALWLESGSLP